MGDMSREPSMEEILSSIRRVIARDDPSLKAGGRPLSPMSEADVRGLAGADPDAIDDGDEDILELTEAEVPVAALSADQQDDSAAMPAKASPVAAIADTHAPELVSPLSAAASRSSLDVLAAVLASGKDDGAAAVTPSGDVSVNALVEAALRPMLRQWLDTNLPGIVEALVAKEIARITGTRG